MNITTDTWLDAALVSPWKGRPVIVRFDDGNLGIGIRSNYRWVDQQQKNHIDTLHKITNIYVFEKFDSDNDCWKPADQNKKFRLKDVLVRFDDGTYGIGCWNGYYWINQRFMNRIDRVKKITHYYEFEKFNPNDIIT